MNWKPPKWLPEGRWIYKHSENFWYLSDYEPTQNTYNQYWCSGKSTTVSTVNLKTLYRLYREKFVEPDVTKLQIKHL